MRPSYLYDGSPKTGKAPLYWDGPLTLMDLFSIYDDDDDDDDGDDDDDDDDDDEHVPRALQRSSRRAPGGLPVGLLCRNGYKCVKFSVFNP